MVFVHLQTSSNNSISLYADDCWAYFHSLQPLGESVQLLFSLTLTTLGDEWI